MAYFQYISQVNGASLQKSFEGLLESSGLRISKEFSNPEQIFAEENSNRNGYKTKVKVLISWSDKSTKQCSIEVRSDEPFLKANTHCERVKHLLHSIIPPKGESTQPLSEEINHNE